jgi:hypothetical protein
MFLVFLVEEGIHNMADSLEQMYNEKPGFFSKITDPFSLEKLGSQAAIKEYGIGEDVGGKGDALRHLLASAVLAKRHSPGYSNFITGLHEAPIPVIGSLAQAPEDKEMDLHNNALGIQLAREAKDYPDLVRKAKANIDSGTAKLVYERATPTRGPDVIDNIINSGSDKLMQFGNWASNYFRK